MEDSGLEIAISEFVRVFQRRPDVAVYAPGRVNLIGEHTDYNDGFVLPFALPFRTIIVGAKANRESNDCRVFSCNMKDAPVAFVANGTLQKGQPQWANYFKGVVFQYLSDLPVDVAFDAVIYSNVPLGSGLSSSAALE